MLGTTLKRWNWLDYLLIPLSVSVLQSVCIAPVFAAILREPSTGISNTGFVFWLCLGIMLGGAAVAQLAHQNSMGIVMIIVGAVASILVSWLLIIPPGAQDLGSWFSNALYTLTHVELDKLPLSLTALVFAVLLWWRGIKSVSPEYESFLGLFAVGLVVQLGILLVRFRSDPGLNWLSLGQILLFLASAMAAFSFIQLSRTISEQHRRSGITWRIDRYWMSIIGGVIIGTLLVGLVVAQLVTPNHIDFLKPLWNVVVNIILFILLILAYLFFSLLDPLLDQFAREGPTETQTFQSALEPMNLEELAQDPVQVPPALFQIFQVLVVVFGIILVVWLLVRALRKRKSSSEIEGVLEERESILSAELLKSQIGNLLSGLGKRRLSPFLDLVGEEDTRRIVRELYQQVLTRASAIDLPRKKGQTPTTYEAILLSHSTEERPAWDTLTQVYNIARYGVQPPTHEQVRMAQDAFARIEPVLKKLEQEHTF